MICLRKLLQSRWLASSLFVCALTLGSIVQSQDKKPDNLPQLLVATPLGVSIGQTSKVVVRGKRLDEVKEVRFNGQTTAIKLLNKGKAGVPQKQEANRAGDSQIEIEVTLPADAKPGDGELLVVSDAGTSEVLKLLIDAEPVIQEKEPNDGFGQSQLIEIGKAVEGTLHQGQNVDVYRFEGKAGDKLFCEVIAARRGSVLDSLLSLYDARQRLIATADDLPGSQVRTTITGTEDLSRRDSRLEITLPSSGVFYLALQDAHDLGGPAHPYRLKIGRADPH